MKSKFIKLELVLKDGQLSQEEFENFLLRSAWYFAPFINSIRSIHVFNQNLKIPKTLTAPSIITPEVNQHISLLLKKLTNEKDDRGGGIINKKYMISIRETSKPLNNSSINLNPRLKGADSRYLSLYSTIFGAKIGSVNKGRKRLLKLKAQINKKKVYLLGTGPSFSSVENNDFSDGELIICNSIVSNKNFLEKWRPKLAVCADPIFHAGYSVYAKAFRDDLKDMVVKYGTYVIVPERDIHIYEHFLPEISSNLIAIPFARNYESINTELQKEFKVSVTSNILTLYMLPIAGYIFETICIAGCDGRSLKDDQYFWSHDKKVQYNDKMKDIQIAHPGFFKLDYNEYYLQHCSTLEKWIKSLENNGKKIINLTSSYIPILNARNASNVQSYEESYYAEINNAIKSY